MPKYICLDMDETLLHAEETPFQGWSVKTRQYYVAPRPGLDHLIESLREDFEFLIWTNSSPPYVREVLPVVWNPEWPLKGILYAHDSVRAIEDGYSVPKWKDLKKLRKRMPDIPKEDLLFVDDKPFLYKRSYGNIIAIRAFFGAPDRELYHLTNYIKSIAHHPNFRKIEKRGWRNRFEQSLDPSP